MTQAILIQLDEIFFYLYEYSDFASCEHRICKLAVTRSYLLGVSVTHFNIQFECIHTNSLINKKSSERKIILFVGV